MAENYRVPVAPELADAIGLRRTVLPAMREWYDQHVLRADIIGENMLRERAIEIRYQWPAMTWEEALAEAKAEARR